MGLRFQWVHNSTGGVTHNTQVVVDITGGNYFHLRDFHTHPRDLFAHPFLLHIF